MQARETVTGDFTTLNEWIEYRRSNPSDPWVSWGSVFNSLTGTQKVKRISSVNTPGFYDLLKCGAYLPYNPVDIKTTETTYTPGEGWAENTGSTLRYEGSAWYEMPTSIELPPVDPAIQTYVTNAAAAEARSSIFDALTFAAELKKTHAMVKGRFSSVADFATKLAYRSAATRRFGKDPLRVMSDLWLEYRYGWIPAVLSVSDALDALANKAEKGSVVNGTSSQIQDLSQSVTETVVSGPSHTYVTTVIDGKRTYRGAYYAQVTNPSLFRYGSDVVRTGYEMVPWSFVFDWFVDVNSYLQAVSPFQGGQLMGGGCSIKDDYTWRQTVNVVYDRDDWTGALQGIKTERKVKHYTRTPMGVSLPGWNPRLTSVRLVDLAALVYGRARNIMKILTR